MPPAPLTTGRHECDGTWQAIAGPGLLMIEAQDADPEAMRIAISTAEPADDTIGFRVLPRLPNQLSSLV
ncbi:MAG: hypothetical protein AAFR53_11935, partial [Pseudomonadota bacterium]